MSHQRGEKDIVLYDISRIEINSLTNDIMIYQ